ncbi:hypothetical protein Lal_00041631 [Lupinus albus]|nr:hypothetical protein Lal_00041631 [Lupinus albus]
MFCYSVFNTFCVFPQEKNQPKFEKETDKYYNLELEMRNFAFIEEVEQVECQSCGLKEECTIVYITQVQECYCGKWIND